MGIIGGILLTLFLGDFLWWWRADRALQRLSGRAFPSRVAASQLPHGKFWRIALAVFMAAQVIGIVLIFLDRSFDLDFPLSSPWVTLTYIWHCLMLFPMLLLWIPFVAARGILAGVRRLLRLRVRPEAEGGPAITRREFGRLLGTAVPALVSLGSAAVALWQIHRFRIRRMEVALPQLPAALDGLTIAHVTDIHVGVFTHGDILDRIVAATNELQADLVLYTGDLINFALSDLDSALAIATQFWGRNGVFLCEGNHDLFENAEEFRRRTRAAGLRLLVNEATTIEIRGVAVQLLGLRWGARDTHPHDPASRRDQAIAHSMAELLPQRQPDAFSILLAHHPHAFDFAEGIPLTLAGHTHGGQLMVSQNLGFGPMLYRFWSGLYWKADRALVVSNGTGNWFPLRTRAPAEIVHITLRRA